MVPLSPALRFFLYAHATDMRKSFDGLSGLVTSALTRDVQGQESHSRFSSSALDPAHPQKKFNTVFSHARGVLRASETLHSNGGMFNHTMWC